MSDSFTVSNEFDAGLYSVLSTNVTLAALIPGGVHKLRAPIGTLTPLLIFHWESRDHEQVFGGRAFTSGRLILKAVSEGLSTVPCYDVLSAAEAAIVGGVSVTGHGVLGLVHVNDPAEYIEDAEGGARYMHVASAWDVTVQ